MNREAKKLLKTRLRHAKIISTLINCQPFVRAVVLNGSLAKGNTGPNSDIDFLIITQSRRIYTARFFATLAAWFTGLKRSNKEHLSHAGKICLNYYMTENFLIIPHHRAPEMNRYCAENYSASILLAGDRQIFERFLAMNESWMRPYIKDQKLKISSSMANSQKDQNLNKSKNSNIISAFQFAMVLKRLTERVLLGRSGQKIENYLKRLQQARIMADPRGRTYPDLIHADDREMRFHPPKNNF